MLWTTTPSIEGRIITAYRDVVIAEVALGGSSLDASVGIIDGVNFDLTLQTERFGEARSKALGSLEAQARALGADAIVGLKFEYVTFGKNGVLNMVSAYGTAVCLKLNAEERQKQLQAEQREKASFWVVIDGKERGPFSIEQLFQLVASRKISEETSARVEGTDESVSVKSLLPE